MIQKVTRIETDQVIFILIYLHIIIILKNSKKKTNEISTLIGLYIDIRNRNQEMNGNE